MAKPILYLNMGGEMLYVLWKRMVSMQVPADKAQKAMAQLVRNMFAPSMIDTMLQPQDDLGSLGSWKKVFQQLTQHTTMRLNEQSMGKLFELMQMTFKLQVMFTSPQEILDVTSNHLEGIQRIIAEDEELLALVEGCSARVRHTYAQLGTADLCTLRHTLAVFLQESHQRVSFLLSEGPKP